MMHVRTIGGLPAPVGVALVVTITVLATAIAVTVLGVWGALAAHVAGVLYVGLVGAIVWLAYRASQYRRCRREARA